ncbi:MAG: Eco57I restriction-modification methylase domain-containing protein [Prevotella sp.]|nr:Eco57I restriction-modification methylase domain-containing protein [Prevotella sp.]MBR1558515.1 Eco57I restriction-modification methylase domain-containing protein [Prevotella sp.]
MLLQKNIVKKQLATLPLEQTAQAWAQYQSYFLNKDIQQNIRQSKEEQFQEGFLRELFVKVLGYTLNPSPDFNLITEKKNETNAKKADGAIQKDGVVIGVIELKDHKTTDLSKVEPQAFNYKSQHPAARYVVISNFEKLRLYIDNAVEYREWDLFRLSEDDFRELYLCLAWQQVERGVALQMKQESVSSEDQITKALYRDYSQFKRVLFADIQKQNPVSEGQDEKDWQVLLFKKTQKLLDRLLFIFFAEDCGLLPPNLMVQMIDQWEQLRDMDAYVPFYERVKKYFGYMNTGFQGKKFEIFACNGGLFKPDEVLDNIKITDELLVEHAKRLSTYDFESDVDVNILGHVFESSLNSSNRKQDGVFYTPQYITKYIVENTVGRLCAEKKQELGIHEDEYFSDQRRQIQTKRRLLEQLSTYRQWLLQITILDPACGSGAFLNAALRFLMDEHHLIDEMEAKVTGSAFVFQDVENSILEHNLYGVDINEESVEIAQLALWLRTAKPHRKLNSLNQNIKCGNSLISNPAIAGEKAFDWQREFPQVFEKGGFDVVIGNPPYVNAIEIKKSYTKEAFNYIKKKYETAKGTVDLYIYFFEKGLSLLKQNGVLAFITPNRYLSASYGAALRNFIIERYSFYQLIDYSDKRVFEDASTYPVITMLQNSQNNPYVMCGKFDEQTHDLISKNYPSNQLDILEECILGFLLNDKLPITQKVISEGEPLSVVGEINATSTAKEADDYAPLISENNNGYKLINTGTIDPYFTIWGNSTLTKQGKQYLTPYLPNDDTRISENRHSLYSSPKIIISKIGLRCEAFYDSKGEYASIDTNCIHSFKEGFLPEYVLCWLNSKLYNYMFECFFDGLRMSGGYLLYSSPNLRNTYIKVISIDDQQPFLALASTMLTLNQQLQEKRSRFLRRLSENMEGVKITTALQTFDRLTFAEFTAELKKQKIRLSLAQQDEWEDYFDDYRQQCQQLSAQIAATDAEIDTRVFDLYGLTDKERKIVLSDLP